MNKKEITALLNSLFKAFPNNFEEVDPSDLVDSWHKKLADHTFAAASQSMWELIGKTNTMPTPEAIVQNIVPLEEVIKRLEEDIAKRKADNPAQQSKLTEQQEILERVFEILRQGEKYES